MRITLFLCVLLTRSLGFSQSDTGTLLSVGDMDISVVEFERVYKKNLELVQDNSQRTVDGYLELFIDYKLKVAEAKAQGLDKDPAYLKEFYKYQDQLSRSYIYEDRVLEELVEEAYERGRYELDVDHILIRVGRNALPQDTLLAYEKIETLRIRVLDGEDFNAIARSDSEDPGGAAQGGKLGYISVFGTVYPFETTAYTTAVGEISDIVRTDFGYHILRVNDKRERSPKIVVSHIMVADRQDAGTLDPEERINEVYSLLQQGQAFEELAKEYSDDKGSATNGGQLRPFSRGELRSMVFTDKAYSLKSAGDTTDPFQSEFGWHIMRLDSVLPQPGYTQQKDDITKRVQQGNRSKVITQNIVDKIKSKYGFTLITPFFEPAMDWIGPEVLQRRWRMDTLQGSENLALFEIGDRTIRLNDYGSYVQERQRRMQLPETEGEMLNLIFQEFEQQEIQRYFKDQLELENPQYAAVISEYRDGLLIFDVMNKNVWSKARTDTVGLEAYFAGHRNDYQWKNRIVVNRYSSSQEETAGMVLESLEAGQDADQIKDRLNTDDEVLVTVTPLTIEEGDSSLPDEVEWKAGALNRTNMNGRFQVWQVIEVLDAGPKELDEIRGKVVGDYQQQLEKEWMESLRAKYPVKVNNKELKKVKRAMGQ